MVVTLRKCLLKAAEEGLENIFLRPGGSDELVKFKALSNVIKRIVGREEWRRNPRQATIDVIGRAVDEIPEEATGRSPELSHQTEGNNKWKGKPEREYARILFGYSDDILVERYGCDPIGLTYRRDRWPVVLRLAALNQSASNRMLKVIWEDTAQVLLDLEPSYTPKESGVESAEPADAWTVIEENIDPKVRHLSNGRLAWNDQIVLQPCPNLTEGWRPSEVEITLDPTEFRWSTAADRDGYRTWLQTADPSVHRGIPKFRLLDYDGSYLDDPGLHLRIQENTWKELNYVHRTLASDDSRRIHEIEKMLGERFELPDTLCLHLTVATRDGYVLLTQRGVKVFYHPNAWSCSIEEQLGDEDLKYGPEQVMHEWIRRALYQELGFTRQQCDEATTRLSAVFLLGDILNVAIAGLVTIGMDRAEFDRHLKFKPKKDGKEFQSWDFFPWSELARRLVNPDRSYNPSSGLRMLLAGIQKFGVESFYTQINNEYAKR
ncbi:hypothetical protein V7968_16350 [Nocardia vulneris]|uniref:hypothetical protein n=1 Tax=Nocardia vulneris TaxID=1141657 RepID=UPI0030CC4483